MRLFILGIVVCALSARTLAIHATDSPPVRRSSRRGWTGFFWLRKNGRPASGSSETPRRLSGTVDDVVPGTGTRGTARTKARTVRDVQLLGIDF